MIKITSLPMRKVDNIKELIFNHFTDSTRSCDFLRLTKDSVRKITIMKGATAWWNH